MSSDAQENALIIAQPIKLPVARKQKELSFKSSEDCTRVTVCVCACVTDDIAKWLNDHGRRDEFRLKSSSIADSPDWISCL